MPTYPTSEAAYLSLTQRGQHFANSARRVTTLNNVTFAHPRHGVQRVKVDSYALLGAGRLYVESELSQSLSPYNPNIASLEQAMNLLRRRLSAPGQVWGFSGYATSGYPYQSEARGMRALLGSLKNMRRLPTLITDGGVSEGVLGLSGVLAKRFSVPSLGFLPRQGLESPGLRDHLVVRMDTYQQRERLVGLTPDVLVCVGGGDGTRRECEVTLGSGGVVLMLTLRDYDNTSLPATYQDFDAIRSAMRDGRLVICTDPKDIQKAARQASQIATQFSIPNREARLRTLDALLPA